MKNIGIVPKKAYRLSFTHHFGHLKSGYCAKILDVPS